MPMPRSLPLRSLRARRSGNDDHSAAVHAAVHHLLELAGIEHELGRRSVGHRRGRHEIDAADGVGAHAELARRGIDEPLEQIGGLRPPGAAIGADRHRVGAHALDVHVDRRRSHRCRRRDRSSASERSSRTAKDRRRDWRGSIRAGRGSGPSHRARVRRAWRGRGPDCRRRIPRSDPPATSPAARACGSPRRPAPARDRRRPSCRMRRRHWA